jgi:hypothetical protein
VEYLELLHVHHLIRLDGLADLLERDDRLSVLHIAGAHLVG